MRRIIKSAIVASALVAGGAAFASEGENSNQELLVTSQLAFASQAANRTAPVTVPVQREIVAPRQSAAAATSQGFAPIDTISIILNGSH